MSFSFTTTAAFEYSESYSSSFFDDKNWFAEFIATIENITWINDLNMFTFVISLISLLVVFVVYCYHWQVQTITKRFYFIQLFLLVLMLASQSIKYNNFDSQGTILCVITSIMFNFSMMAANLYQSSIGIILVVSTISNTKVDYNQNLNLFKKKFIDFELWNHLAILLVSIIFSVISVPAFFRNEIYSCCYTFLGLMLTFLIPYLLLSMINFGSTIICSIILCANYNCKIIENPVSLDGKFANFNIHLVKEILVFAVFTFVNFILIVTFLFGFALSFSLALLFINCCVLIFSALLLSIYVLFNPSIWAIVLKKRFISTLSIPVFDQFDNFEEMDDFD